MPLWLFFFLCSSFFVFPVDSYTKVTGSFCPPLFAQSGRGIWVQPLVGQDGGWRWIWIHRRVARRFANIPASRAALFSCGLARADPRLRVILCGEIVVIHRSRGFSAMRSMRPRLRSSKRPDEGRDECRAGLPRPEDAWLAEKQSVTLTCGPRRQHLLQAFSTVPGQGHLDRDVLGDLRQLAALGDHALGIRGRRSSAETGLRPSRRSRR